MTRPWFPRICSSDPYTDWTGINGWDFVCHYGHAEHYTLDTKEYDYCVGFGLPIYRKKNK